MCEAGIAVQPARKAHGGYQVARGIRLPLAAFTTAGGGHFRAPGTRTTQSGWSSTGDRPEFETKFVFDAPYDEVARQVRPPTGLL